MSAQVASQWRTYRCQSATHVRALRAELHRGHGGCKIPPSQRPLALRSALWPPLSLGRGPSSDRAGPPLRDGMPSPGRHLRGYLVDLRVFLPLPLTPLEPLPPIEPSPPPGAFPRRTPPPKAVGKSPSIFWQRATFQGKVACGIPQDGTVIQKIFRISTRAAENNRVETQKGAPPGVRRFAGILGMATKRRALGSTTDTGASEEETMALRRTKIVLFGDSITQQAFSTKHSGWAAAVNDAYQRKVDIVNRGYSGYNTRWASQLVHEVSSHFASGSPANGRDILTIFFGANDASLADGTAAAQHVPIAEYKANLGKLIDFVRSDHGSRAPQIVLITPPPVHERSWAKFCGEETSNRWEALFPFRRSAPLASRALASRALVSSDPTPSPLLFWQVS